MSRVDLDIYVYVYLQGYLWFCSMDVSQELVGGFTTSEKIGMIIPNIWENQKYSKPPTRYDVRPHQAPASAGPA